MDWLRECVADVRRAMGVAECYASGMKFQITIREQKTGGEQWISEHVADTEAEAIKAAIAEHFGAGRVFVPEGPVSAGTPVMQGNIGRRVGGAKGKVRIDSPPIRIERRVVGRG